MGRAVSCQLERDLVDVDGLPIPLQVLDLTLDLAVFFPGHDHIPRLCALEHDALPAPRPEHLFDLVERASVFHGPLFLSLDDVLGDRGRHFFIVVGLHRETAPPLGHRAEPGRIAEHFGEGNLGVDHLDQAAVVHGLDRAAFGAHIARYIAQKFCGGDHLHRHDGFENDGLGPSRRLLERHGGRALTRTWPYWPRPPDGRMYLPSASASLLMVSLYATCGRPTLASTPNSRFMRSTMISRWSSPMPAMIVSPVSMSPETRKVGPSPERGRSGVRI